VPQGSLASTTTLTVSCDPAATVAGFALLSPLYRFEPAGLTFARPVTVTLAFTGSSASPSMYWSRPDGSGYDAISSSVQGAFVVGSVTHFSTGFVGTVATPPGDAGLDAAPDAGPDAPASCSLPSDPPTAGVPCGAVSCSGDASACCHNWNDGGVGGCVPSSFNTCDNSPYPSGNLERCDGPEDCPPGQFCYDQLGGNSYCAAPIPLEGAIVCHSSSDCPPPSICGEAESFDSVHHENPAYSMRTCTIACSSDSDCIGPADAGGWRYVGGGDAGPLTAIPAPHCYASNGCAPTCHWNPLPSDGGSDAGSDAAPEAGVLDGSLPDGCITPYTPGFAIAGGAQCNLEFQLVCMGTVDAGRGSLPGPCHVSGLCPASDPGGNETNCDGPEDCPAGDACWPAGCFASDGGGYPYPLGPCGTSNQMVCHSDSDCVAAYPYCYFQTDPSCASPLPTCNNVPPPADAGAAYGACTVGAGPSSYGVSCGSTTCTSQVQECCMGGTTQCQARSAACSATRMQCDGPEDCAAGQRCFAGGAIATNSSGMAVYCTGTNGGALGNFLCHSAADCLAGQSCVPADASPWSYCQ
jgi:hypothetical protein